jgi:hypothetical protein
VRGTGGIVNDIAYSGYLLRGLPPSYEMIKVVLNTQRGDPDTIKNSLLSEEARLKESEVRGTGPRAFAMTSKGQSKGQGSLDLSSKRKCYYCGKEGHYKRDCRKWKAKMNSEKETDKKSGDSKDSETQSSRRLSLMAYYAKDTPTPPEQQWYLDSGASDHITGNIEAFTEFREITPFPITLGDSSTVLVTGTGKVALNLEDSIVEFSGVLYSKHFGNTSLLSVPQLAQKEVIIIFEKERVQLKLKGRTVALGTLCKNTGLYKLSQKQPRNKGKVFKSTVLGNQESLQIQHRRYGHINNDYVQKSISYTTGLGNKPLKGDPKLDCEICAISKAHRASMPSNRKQLKPMDLLSLDIWGPSPIPSLQGNIDLLGVTDNGSGVRQVFPMPDRKGFLPILQGFVNRLENQTGIKIKGFRLDNAPEFKSKRMIEWATSQGYELQSTTIYTPEQNGVAERGFQVILDGTRCNIADSELPPEFWDFATEHFVFGHNYCYKPAIEKTPYEALYGKKPDASKLKIFGSLVYCYIPKEKRNKLQPKAFPGILVGYAGSGYKIWDPIRHEIVVSNHVQIKEDCKGAELLAPENLAKLRAQADLWATTQPDERPANEVYDTSFLPIDHIVVDVPGTEYRGQLEAAQVTMGNRQSQEHLQGHANTGNTSPSAMEQLPEIGAQEDQPEQEILPSIEPESHDLAPKLFRGKPVPLPTRTSSRIRAATTTPGPLEASQTDLHTNYMAIGPLGHQEEPSTFKEALQGPDSEKWQLAIKSEMKSLLQNKTWDLVLRPKGKNIVSSKWVFKIKDNGQFKARMVARGFSQEYGLDYFETYAPVARFASLRLVLAIAAYHCLQIQQMDVDTAFLYGNLEEEIYMEQPEGYIDDSSLVCKLRKSLYGLKQAPRVWYQVIDKFFRTQGLVRSGADPAVYVETRPISGQIPLIVAIYVDDLIIVHKDIARINSLKEALNSKFNMKDLGRIRNLLGMEVHCLENGSIFINQPTYIRKLLKRHGMENCKTISTPMALKIIPSEDDFDAKRYQSLMGELIWPSLGTRPDIAFPVGYLAR